MTNLGTSQTAGPRTFLLSPYILTGTTNLCCLSKPAHALILLEKCKLPREKLCLLRRERLHCILFLPLSLAKSGLNSLWPFRFTPKSGKVEKREKYTMGGGGFGGGGRPPGTRPWVRHWVRCKSTPKRFPLNSLANGIWSMDSKIYLHLKRTPSFHVNNWKNLINIHF